jgi:hypothetical protein
MSGNTETLQKWEVTGRGRRGGVGSAEVEVSAIVERHVVPLYRYAAFATNTGCNALSFSGGARTKKRRGRGLAARSRTGTGQGRPNRRTPARPLR